MRILKGSYLYHHAQVSNKVGFTRNIVVKKEDMISLIVIAKDYIDAILKKESYLGSPGNNDYELLSLYLLDDVSEPNKLKKLLNIVSKIDRKKAV